MTKKTFQVSGIKWDAPRSVKKDLPKTMEVTVTTEDVEDLDDEDWVDEYISDYISDETGYCHYGYELKEI